MYPHVVFVVCGAGEGTSTAGLRAVVRPLPGVSPDVDLSDVGGRKGPAATLDGALERFLPCRRGADGEPGVRVVTRVLGWKPGLPLRTCVSPRVLLQVSRCFEGLAAVQLLASVWLLPRVRA